MRYGSSTKFHIRPFLRLQGESFSHHPFLSRGTSLYQSSLSHPLSLSVYSRFFMPSPPRSYTSFPSHADLFYFCTTSSTSEEDLNIHYAPPSKSSLRVGVVVLSPDQVQLLDLAALDLLATLGRNRISKINTSSGAVDEAIDEIDIRYVSVTGEGSFPVTSGSRMPVTVS